MVLILISFKANAQLYFGKILTDTSYYNKGESWDVFKLEDSAYYKINSLLKSENDLEIRLYGKAIGRLNRTFFLNITTFNKGYWNALEFVFN